MATTALPEADERLTPEAPEVVASARLARPLPAGRSAAALRLDRPGAQPLRVRLFFIILFGALLTSSVVSWSFRHGRLILPPGYDDVSYMDDAARRLRILHDSGVGTVLYDYVTNKPPHSPYTAVLGLLAFTVFGVHDWAVYVASGVLVCGYFAMTDRLLRGVPLWQKLLAFALVMSVPLVVRSADEFRPDHASALLLCGGLILLLERPFLRSSRRHKIGAGALIGLAVLAKPPMFIAAGLLTGWALLLATACDLMNVVASRTGPAAGADADSPFGLRGLGAAWDTLRARRWEVALAWADVVMPAVLIPWPHFLVAGEYVVKYIWVNMFGEFRTVWQTKGSLGFHLNYYLFGEGGQTMLGGRTTPNHEVFPRHLVLLGLILLAGAVHVLVRRRRAEVLRAAALAAMLLATYAIPAFTRTKSIFFGLNFHTFLLLLAVLTLRHLLRAERLQRAWAARRALVPPAPRFQRPSAPPLPWRSPVGPAAAFLIVVAGCGVISWSWPTRVGDVNADWIRNRRQIVEGVYRSVLDDPAYHNPKVFVACVGDVNAQVLRYMSYRDVAPVTFYDIAYSDDLPAAQAEIDRADMVVAAETGSELIADYLPIYRLQDELLKELRERQDYRAVGRFIYERTGKGFYVFEHIRSFGGWSRIDGFGPAEGPSAITDNRIVHWGWGPATTMQVAARSGGEYTLSFAGRGWGGQEMTVKVDGREVARLPVPEAQWGHFTQGTVPFHLSAGNHEVRLEYRIWDLTTPRPMGVLFEQLLVKKVK